jgi:hypothetical protein
MSKWFRYERNLYNLDKCTRIYPRYREIIYLAYENGDTIELSYDCEAQRDQVWEEILEILK